MLYLETKEHAGKAEAEIDGVKEEAGKDELMILNVETVAPVPVRKRRRSTQEEGKKETIFTCVICGTYFYGRGNLRDHYSLTHFKGKLRRLLREDKECPICIKTFSTNSNTIRHLGSVHKKIEEYLAKEEKNSERKSKAIHMAAAKHLAGKNGNKLSLILSVYPLLKSSFLFQN